MVKVKSFTSRLEIFHTAKELDQLDEQVNKFISEKSIKEIISVSDTCTTGDRGITIGIIRALTYEDGE